MMDMSETNKKSKQRQVAQNMAAKNKGTFRADKKKWDEYYGPAGYLTKDLKTMGLKAPKRPK